MNDYIPPFDITNMMLDRVASIMKKIGMIDNYQGLNKMPVLRKNNRIRSIHSSLAIEANSLSFNQVRDVISGKTVIGDKNDIQEVKNAYKAYEMMMKFNPYSIDDIKKAHGIMTYLLVDETGKFRTGAEGVFDENNNCIFMAPKPEMVDTLMDSLFNWMREKKNEINPLILSSVFHYEFVFIHPFADGNGRMARLWQTMILADWKEVFAYVPIESLIKDYQDDYYKAINECNNKGDSTIFVEFMLKMIDETLTSLIDNINKELTHRNEYVNKLLEVMDVGIPMSSKEIMDKLNLKSRKSFRENYIQPALDMNLIKMTEENKPTSKNQRYYKE